MRTSLRPLLCFRSAVTASGGTAAIFGSHCYTRVSAGMEEVSAEERTPLLRVEPGSGEKIGNLSRRAAAAEDSEIEPFPLASFTQARTENQKRLPQCIAHRGYKAENPENTMCAFKAAINNGKAQAIETDIHLSKDNVVVLSHDPDLKRCFGRTERIIDCDWDFLSKLRTTKAPHEPMPRLRDLLEYIAGPELQSVWILLDIKLDNNAEDVMRLIAETLGSVNPGERPWHTRVVLGIWAAKYLSLCKKYLSDFPIAYIGFSTCYARQFLKVPHVGFNMFAKTLFGPIGNRFIRDVQRQHRPLYLWTVNEVNIMKWAIKKKVDGVITDDPRLFNEVCEDYQGEDGYVTWSQWVYTIWLYVLIAVFSVRLKKRFPGSVDTFLKSEQLKIKEKLDLGA